MEADRVAREGARGWRRTLWATVLSQLVALIGFGLAVPFLPLYLQDLGITDPSQVALWSGVVYAAPFFPMAVTAPIWGALSDRYGRKLMLLRSIAGGGVVLALMGLATNAWQLMLLRAVSGAVAGSIQAAMALVATTAPKRALGAGLGLVQTAVYVGNSIGPFLGGLLAEAYGVRNSFFIGGGIVIAAMLVVAALGVESKRPKPEQGRTSFSESLGVLRLPRLRSLLVAQGLSVMPVFATFPLIPIYLQHLTRPPWLSLETASGIALGITYAVGAVASVWLGRLGDRVGHRRIVILSVAGGALVFLPQAFVTDALALILLRGLLGVATGGLAPSLNVLMKEAAPSGQEGSVYGAASATQSVGLALGSLGAGALAALLGVPAVLVVLAALLASQAAWMVRALPRTSNES